MVKVTVYQGRSGAYKGMKLEDHAYYDVPGSDIVCAAVSALVTNCVNSIEQLTDASISFECNEEAGTLSFFADGEADEKAGLLISSAVIGLQSIEDNEQYEPYIDIIFKEV